MNRYVVILASVLLLSSCTGPGIAKKDFALKSQSISIGMRASEFLQLFPDATPRGAKQYSKGIVTVYELLVSHYHMFGTGNPNYSRNEWSGVETQTLWYYFYNNALVQYGKPGDWPAEPDVIIENRIQ